MLNKLICYVFDRRYGWLEVGRNGMRWVRRMFSIGIILEVSDGYMKVVLNDFFDNIIRW